MELPTEEGNFSLVLEDGTELEAYFNPASGHWLNIPRTEEFGFQDRIGETKLRSWIPV